MDYALLLNVMTSLALLVCTIDKDCRYYDGHYTISDMGNYLLLIALFFSVISTVMLANERRRQQKNTCPEKSTDSIKDIKIPLLLSCAASAALLISRIEMQGRYDPISLSKTGNFFLLTALFFSLIATFFIGFNRNKALEKS